jgi:hypothetical protein
LIFLNKKSDFEEGSIWDESSNDEDMF